MSTTTGGFAQIEIRKRRQAFLRKHRWRLALMAAVGLAAVVGAAVLFPQWSVPGWGALLFVLLLVPVVAKEQVDGTYYLVAGRDAERWTSKDLRRMLGKEWRVVDNVWFWHGDADHVVVGPAGVFVVETKYTDSAFNLKRQRSRRDADDWAAAAKRRARSTRLLLQTHGVDVHPVVLIWGGCVTDTPFTYDGVPFLHRRDLAELVSRWKDAAQLLQTPLVEVINQDLLGYKRKRQAQSAR